MPAVLLSTSARFHQQPRVVLKNGQLDALHGRAAKCGAVLLVVPLKQLSKIDCAAGKSWLKRRIGRIWSALVPWTDILANIAAVEPIGQIGGLIESAAMLYGQIGDAPAGIEPVRLSDCVGRACINAARAGSAAIDSRFISRKRQRCDHFTQKHPRPDLLIDDAGVLPQP